MCDLVHTWGSISVWTQPINLGFVGGYANAQHGSSLDITLFKRPESAISEIRRDPPDILALAYYVWNRKLNDWVSEIARAANPQILIVGGGPQFTSLNWNEKSAIEFFSESKNIDVFAVNQGERPFSEIVHTYLSGDRDTNYVREQKIPGTLVNCSTRNRRVLVGEELSPIKDLDEIPSPYLNGMLDSFFEEDITPIIETNRSCPFRCTFCAWGIGTEKLSQFSLERVFSEIDYIAEQARNDTSLFIADANFSILARDLEIARKLKECSIRKGFPTRINIQWNKTRPDRVKAAAAELEGLTMVGASMQTFNKDSLDVIKRKNLSLDQVVDIHQSLNKEGAKMELFSELILGLPEETSASHLSANRKLIDIGAQTFNYNLHLLPGTEMDSAAVRSRYFRKTGWRLHDNAYGIYLGKGIFEGQEVVQETTTMPQEEISRFRFFHFLLQFLWQYRWYYELLQFLRQRGIHPVDFILEIANDCANASGAIGELYGDFYEDYHLEQFDSYYELKKYWERPHNLSRLEKAEYGKLNYQYTFRILLDVPGKFSAIVKSCALRMLADGQVVEHQESDEGLVDSLVMFSQEKLVQLEETGIVEKKVIEFPMDLLAWRESLYKDQLNHLEDGSYQCLIFRLPPTKTNVLRARLEKFRSNNINHTLRKMTEYAHFDMLQYDIEVGNGN
jgi:radical SAM superfamily enzyme YgiQ (UPF0313 family)